MTEAEWIAEAKIEMAAAIRVLERHAAWVKDPQEKSALLAQAQMTQAALDKAPTAKEKAPSA